MKCFDDKNMHIFIDKLKVYIKSLQKINETLMKLQKKKIKITQSESPANS